MQTRDVTFHSDGLKLAGSFFVPDNVAGTEKAPLVIACSGFTGLRTIHPARFARFLTARGICCFGFDYRGFAESEGQRGRVLLEEQVRDIMHAVAYAATDRGVDPTRIVLLGWGMAGGMVIDAARQLDGIIGLIAANGFFVGDRVQRALRGDAYAAFRERVARERRSFASTGVAAQADPFDIYPLDAQSRGYVDAVLRRTPKYDAEPYSWELGDSLLRWNVEAYASGMQTPLLIAHGTENRLHPVAEAQSLYDNYGGEKELFWLEGAGHTEFMDDADPRFIELGEALYAWLAKRLDA